MGMTIDEAIKELERAVPIAKSVGTPEAVNAIQLGIEALKRLQSERHTPEDLLFGLLPGEAEK